MTSVTNECEDLCPQYVARVIRNVKVGPSPAWLVERLQAVFRKKRKDGTFEVYKPINNIVDITNYVLMECGQPLHAFDFDKLAGKWIVVRRARAGEKLVAIDHADISAHSGDGYHRRWAAAGGNRRGDGGAGTEITEGTTNVLIEVANFIPRTVRTTARLAQAAQPFVVPASSEGSTFSRWIMPAVRCCKELILKLAGGELYEEPVVAGTVPEWTPPSIELRFSRIRKVLGIEIPKDECIRIPDLAGPADDGAGGGRQGNVPSAVVAVRSDAGDRPDRRGRAGRRLSPDLPENCPIPGGARGEEFFWSGYNSGLPDLSMRRASTKSR